MRRIALLVLGLAASPAAGREVVMAVGLSLPPYVITDGWTGLEYDIVREALAAEGHGVRPRLMALARVAKELETGQVDAAMTMHPGSGVAACYSDVHVTYHNVAISLARRGLVIDRPEDLAGKSVVAFQRAKESLGERFARAVADNPRYREEARQVVQPLLLYLGRVDAVVADHAIFAWYANDPEVRAKADTLQPLRFHAIFPPTDYRVAFRRDDLCESFNRGLRALKASGAYDQIVRRYARYLSEESGLRRQGLRR
jgi:polar amino acid transport system substrate-binding protein